MPQRLHFRSTASSDGSLRRPLRCAATLVGLLLAAAVARAEEVAGPPPRPEFTRLVAHWAEYADPGYLKFIEDARPDVAQVGFYGGHFWSLAHTPDGAGYPAHFPVVGLDECGRWFEDLNGELHARGAKVVGHFNVKFLVGDPEGAAGPDGAEGPAPRGFFKFYRDLWDEAELGPRPVENPLEMLEVDRAGAPLVEHGYGIGGMAEYWACLNNPHWRTVLKAWAKRGIERGLDGYIINYFYRHDCHCRHCREGFKAHLAERYTAEELHAQFAIADLAAHEFAEIVSWHDPAESTPLRREMLRWSQLANKRAFDEVFVEYARGLKPDLLLAQWNHLGDFNQINGDERCLLPAEEWGRGEDYLWYSSGGAACFTDLAEGFLGELTLQCRYIRGAFDDKPYTMGKYEHTRIRAAIAELAANGGAPMGFYTRFTDPPAREEIVRYYNFMGRHDAVYRGNRAAGEAALLYPRSAVHAGDVAAVEQFKRLGRELLDRHVLFDVLPDDVVPDDASATDEAAAEHLGAYGGRVFAVRGEGAIASAAAAADGSFAYSTFDAPATVRVSASRPAAGDELTLHFVNYNRTEPAEKRSTGTGQIDERPIAAAAIACDVRLPDGFRALRVSALTPESPEGVALQISQEAGRVRFTLPGFVVYAVARVELGER